MTQENFNDLPPDPRSALLGLIGSTFAELKNIDSHLITKNSNIAGIKTDLNRLVAEANSLNNQVPVQAPVQQPVAHTPNVPALEPIPVTQSASQPHIESQPRLETYTGEDPNQLMFDFYRKITPDDINSRLADIDLKLSKILDLLNGLKDKK